MSDLSNIVESINKKGGSLEILDQHIDTSTAGGKAFLQMLGVFAEFETDLRKERQIAGIINAKAKGKHMGRPAKLSAEMKASIMAGHKAGKNPTTLSKEFGVSRASIYNVLKEIDHD